MNTLAVNITMADIVAITFLSAGLVFWIIFSIVLGISYDKKNQIKTKGYIVGTLIGINVIFVFLLFSWALSRIGTLGKGFSVFKVDRTTIFIFYLLVVLLDLTVVITWILIPERLDPNSWQFLWKIKRKMIARAKADGTYIPSQEKVKVKKVKEKKIKVSKFQSQPQQNTYSQYNQYNSGYQTNNQYSNNYYHEQQNKEQDALKAKKLQEQLAKQQEQNAKKIEKLRQQQLKKEQKTREEALRQQQLLLREQRRREEEKRKQILAQQQEKKRIMEQKEREKKKAMAQQVKAKTAASFKVKNDFLYRCLGLTPSASDEAIKKAYRILAKKYHPDLSTEPGAPEKFMKIQKAYEVLSDKAKKMLYDREGVYKK